jgi:hypothetical protein
MPRLPWTPSRWVAIAPPRVQVCPFFAEKRPMSKHFLLVLSSLLIPTLLASGIRAQGPSASGPGEEKANELVARRLALPVST